MLSQQRQQEIKKIFGLIGADSLGGEQASPERVRALYDTQYLKGVSQSFSAEEYVIVDDIRSETHLVAKRGTKLNRAQLERMDNFNVMKPVDECLMLKVDRGASIGKILDRADQLRKEFLTYGTIEEDGRTFDIFKEIVTKISFDRVALSKITYIERREPSLMHRLVGRCLLTTKIGTALKLELVELVELNVATLFSDFGLVFIDPLILAKPQPTEAEFRHVMVHPLIGYIILSEARSMANKSYPERVKNAVLNHHELLDGNGYPRKLKEDEIGIFERIIAVASAYDEEIKKGYRKYGERISQEVLIEKSLTELRENHPGLDKGLVDLLTGFHRPIFARGTEKLQELKAIFREIWQVINCLSRSLQEEKDRDISLKVHEALHEMIRWIISSGMAQLDMLDIRRMAGAEEALIENDAGRVVGKLRESLERLYLAIQEKEGEKAYNLLLLCGKLEYLLQ